MTNHLDRAAEIIAQPTPVDVPGYRLRYTVEAARALEDAGMLATPEHDAAVAAKALREAAHGLDHGRTYRASDIKALLYGRADRIEREAGESDADA